MEIPRKSLNEFDTFRVPFCGESSCNNSNLKSQMLLPQSDVNHSESEINLEKECLKSDCWRRRLTDSNKGNRADADYYENKLAELYVIELGFKT